MFCLLDCNHKFLTSHVAARLPACVAAIKRLFSAASCNLEVIKNCWLASKLGDLSVDTATLGAAVLEGEPVGTVCLLVAASR